MRPFFVVIILIILSLGLVTATDAASTKEKFDKAASEILRGLRAFDPVRSTAMGIHDYDSKFTDWSSKNVRGMVSLLDKYERKLHPFKKTKALNLQERINYKLVKAEVDILLQDLSKIKWHTKAPQLYAKQAIEGIAHLMLSNHAPLAERVDPIIARMKALPTLIKQARENLKKVPSSFIELGSDEFENAIDFYQAVGAELMKQFPERADEILRVSTLAREVMNDFVVYLSELEPAKSPRIAIGKLNYEYKLSNEHFITEGTERLLAEADSLLTRLQESCAEYVSLVMEQHQNGQDSIFVPNSFDRDDILAYYQWEANQVKLYCQQAELMSVPETLAELTIAEIPSHLRVVLPAMKYHRSAPFDSASTGIFYVRPIPAKFDQFQRGAKYRYVHRRGLNSNLVREGFPGHHLQSQLAAAHPDPIRRWQRNALFEEGWADYCVELVYNESSQGTQDPTKWLAILEEARHRLALMMVDIKLHTEKQSIDESLDWLAKVLKIESESGKHFLKREIVEIAWHPTRALGGAWGKRELQKMRQSGRDNLGVEFSLRAFHDQLLTQGAIPPKLLWDILDLSKQ